MAKRITGICIFVLALVSFALPYLSKGAEIPSISFENLNLPEPVTDLWNTLKAIRINISIDVSSLPLVSNAIQALENPETFFQGAFRSAWESINNRVKNAIGVGLSAIVKAFANFFAWIFETIAGFFKHVAEFF